MSLLFVNACMREGSRTERLARAWLERYEGAVEEVLVANAGVAPLDDKSIVTYNEAVATHDFSDPMFDVAKQFVAADEILVAAPFWNFAMPAKLHDYFELVCTQGISFDMEASGAYVSMVRAKRLTYVTTSGGFIPDGMGDHAFGYVQTLSREFWHIPELACIKAEGLDIIGADVDAILAAALEG